MSCSTTCPRALQWIQNQSLAHFPTIYDNQNTRPYFTELLVLNMMVLSGSARLANAVQLFSAVGMMIAAAGIVSILGGGRKSQWVAGLFTFSLPMGLLQLTTPKDDVMAGFWIATMLYFVVLSKRRRLAPLELVALGLTLGLGMLTKGTFLPFAVPIMAWYFLPRLQRSELGKLLREGILLMLLAGVLNGAFWVRNIKTYGGPYGDRLPLVIPFIGNNPSTSSAPDMVGDRLELAMGLQDSIVNRQLIKIAQMAAMNLMTPVSALNEGILNLLAWFPAVYPESYRNMLREGVWIMPTPPEIRSTSCSPALLYYLL